MENPNLPNYYPGYTDPREQTTLQDRLCVEIASLRSINAELLAALRNLVNDFDKSVITTDPMLIEARAAIAKAERYEVKRNEPIWVDADGNPHYEN